MKLNILVPGNRNCYGRILGFVCFSVILFWSCKASNPAAAIPDGFSSLVHGRTLEGWHISLTSHHGVSGDFFMEKGVLVLKQEPFGQGGILLTNQAYKDFELHFEFKGDPGTNGGLLFRSSETGSAYQLELVGDGGKGTAALFGEMLRVEKTIPAPDLRHIWRKGEWNAFRLRVKGEAPQIQLWINGASVWQVQMERNDLQAGRTEGMLGLQLHWSSTLLPIPGGSCCAYSWRPEAAHRYRNLFIKAL